MRVKGKTKLTNKWKQAFSAKNFSITDMLALMKIKMVPKNTQNFKKFDQAPKYKSY